MARQVKATRRAGGLPEPANPPDERAPSGRPEHESPEGDAHVSPLEEEIRLRAYYRYLEREREAGDEMSDWLEAESDVLGRHATGVDIDEKVVDGSPPMGEPRSEGDGPGLGPVLNRPQKPV
jgi:hypothetical protein